MCRLEFHEKADRWYFGCVPSYKICEKVFYSSPALFSELNPLVHVYV